MRNAHQVSAETRSKIAGIIAKLPEPKPRPKPIRRDDDRKAKSDLETLRKDHSRLLTMIGNARTLSGLRQSLAMLDDRKGKKDEDTNPVKDDDEVEPDGEEQEEEEDDAA